MINIDTRLIDTKSTARINEKELWLLVHVAKRINIKNLCWPSNDLLLNDTGWHIEKLQSVKKSLAKKGLIEIIRRGDKSNVYKINTEFLGVFITCKGEWQEQNESSYSIDGKTDTHTITGKTDIIGAGKTNNEVLTNEALANFTESKDSVSKKPLDTEVKAFELSSEIQTKDARARKSKEDAPPEYSKFVELWMIYYKPIGLKMPRDGKMIKSLIQTTREVLIERKASPTPENVVEFWEIFLQNLHRTWGHGKDLATIDSKYKTLIFDLENGKATAKTRQPSTRDIITALAKS